MLIISKYKDYYDGVVGTTGVDKTIVYNRDSLELKENEYPDNFKRKIYGSYFNNNVTPFVNLCHFSLKKDVKYIAYSHFIVGFCGKLYVGWKMYFLENPKDRFSTLLYHIIYDFNELKKYVKETSYNSNIYDEYISIVNYNAFDLFIKYKTPVFIYDNDYKRTTHAKYTRQNDGMFILNPCLKEYEFYKVFDTYQAFQEIQMFLGGVLGAGEKEIIEVDDKYKIAQHGFDKWSFRKEPNKKNTK